MMQDIKLGISNHWNGIWNGTMEWKYLRPYMLNFHGLGCITNIVASIITFELSVSGVITCGRYFGPYHPHCHNPPMHALMYTCKDSCDCVHNAVGYILGLL